ncbi:MAG: WYL domain-containing protein [Planctomycetes bacterium]|nr:WYL domain-containing protein [Planctomycetota bacterium]
MPIALNLATIVHRLLTHSRGWRVADLCAELEIADRTYRKYRQLLQEQFFPLIDGGVSQVQEVLDGETRYLRLVRPEQQRPPVAALLLKLTAHQLALRVLTFLGQNEGHAALEEAFEAFWSEARAGGGYSQLTRIRRDLDRLFHFVPDAPKDYTARADLLATVLEALIDSRRLCMRYTSAAQGAKEHEVEPLTLAMYRGGLHLFARYAGRTRVYNFVVDRIESARLLETVFPYPAPRDYHPQRFTEAAFGIFFRDQDAAKTTTEVELVFANEPWLKLYLQERQWAEGQSFRELEDGRLRMCFKTPSMVEVWPWIRRFGEDVEVVRPSERAGAKVASRP